MTYAEASKKIQDFTGLPLLESLEQFMDMDDLDMDMMPSDVRVAHRFVFRGMQKMFHG